MEEQRCQPQEQRGRQQLCWCLPPPPPPPPQVVFGEEQQRLLI
jgi:hypothetical protein